MNETNTLLYKKYTSHTLFSKGLLKGYVWKVSWRRRETATYWPKVPLTYSAGMLNRGPWGPKPSVWSWFSLRHLISNWNCNSNSNWLCNWPKPSVAPGYIIVCRPPASCGRMHLHQIGPRPQVKVIFRYLRPGAPVSVVHLLIYTGASLNWRLGRGSIYYKFTYVGNNISSLENYVNIRIGNTWAAIDNVVNHMKIWFQIKWDFLQFVVVAVLHWTLRKRKGKKLDGNYTKMLCAVLSKSWMQNPTRQQLFSHLPPILQNI